MSDKPLDPVVRAWLKGTDAESDDVRRSARIISSRVEQTRQRGRWWPLPSLRRQLTRSATLVATHDRPGDMPNIDSHPATVTGRTQSMISPVKAIAAGALIFAVGGVMLIAQPFGQRGSSPLGAAADPAVTTPIAFTARFVPSSSVRAGSVETVDGHIEERGSAWSPIIMDMSEPRLDGSMTYSSDADSYLGPDGTEQGGVGTATYRIETEDGAWQGSTVTGWGFIGWGSGYDEDMPSVVVLTGEGVYEGLHAVMDTSDWGNIRGVILPGPPPEAPTAP